MSEKTNEPKANEVETLLVLKQHRARPFGKKEAERFLPGDKYQQSGLDKLQVLGTGYCTRDLKAEVPENPKRKAPKPGQEKYNDPYKVLLEQNQKMLEILTQLVADKKK